MSKDYGYLWDLMQLNKLVYFSLITPEESDLKKLTCGFDGYKVQVWGEGASVSGNTPIHIHYKESFIDFCKDHNIQFHESPKTRSLRRNITLPEEPQNSPLLEVETILNRIAAEFPGKNVKFIYRNGKINFMVNSKGND
jgi:hypothetical protein